MRETALAFFGSWLVYLTLRSCWVIACALWTLAKVKRPVAEKGSEDA